MHILTDCQHCGEPVGIAPALAWLLVYRPSSRLGQLRPRFGFDCPVCSGSCEGAITPEQEARLVDAGVAATVLDDPRDRHPSVAGRRLREEAVPAARAFTEDDVRELHDLLSDEGWFAALLAADAKP